MDKKLKFRNSLLLLLTATIWGVAFVAQSVGMQYIGPFTFNCVRCFLGGMVLIPCIWLLDRLNHAKEGKTADRDSLLATEIGAQREDKKNMKRKRSGEFC